LKPKLPTLLPSQRASVVMSSAGWDLAKRGLISPNAELNADLTSLEDVSSVSELGVEFESGSELLIGRSTSMTRPTPRLASVSHALIMLCQIKFMTYQCVGDNNDKNNGW